MKNKSSDDKRNSASNHDMLMRAAKYLINGHRRHRWQKVVGVLAAIVVFVTTYILILPAITMEIEQSAELGDGFLAQVMNTVEFINTESSSDEEEPVGEPEEAAIGDSDDSGAAVVSGEGLTEGAAEPAAEDVSEPAVEETSEPAAEADASELGENLTESTEKLPSEPETEESSHEASDASSSMNASESASESTDFATAATEPATEAETVTESKSEAEPESESESPAEPETEAETEKETGKPTESETETEKETETETAAERETEKETETTSEKETEAPTESETGSLSFGVMLLSDTDTSATVTTPTPIETASEFNTVVAAYGLDKIKFAIGGAALNGAGKSGNASNEFNHYGTYHLLTTLERDLGFAGNESETFPGLNGYCKSNTDGKTSYKTYGETGNGYLTAAQKTTYSIWYFEKSTEAETEASAENSTESETETESYYYIYTFDGEDNRYLMLTPTTQDNTASLSLTADVNEATPFYVSSDTKSTLIYKVDNNNGWTVGTKGIYPLNIVGKVTLDTGSTKEYCLSAYFGNNAGTASNGYGSQHGFAGIAYDGRTYQMSNSLTYLTGIDLYYMSDATPVPEVFTLYPVSTESEKVTLTWTESAGALSYAVSVYEGTDTTGEPVKTMKVGSKTTCEVDGLVDGTEYTFVVTAKNKAGSTDKTVTATPHAPVYTELDDISELETLYKAGKLDSTAFAIAGIDLRKVGGKTLTDCGSYHLLSTEAWSCTAGGSTEKYNVLRAICNSPDRDTAENDTMPLTNTQIEDSTIWYFERSIYDDYPYYISTFIEADGKYTKEYLKLQSSTAGNLYELVLTKSRREATAFVPETEEITAGTTTMTVLRLKDENGYYLTSFYSDYPKWAKHVFMGATAKTDTNNGDTLYLSALRLLYVENQTMPDAVDNSEYEKVTLTLNLSELNYSETADTTSRNSEGVYSFTEDGQSDGYAFDKYSVPAEKPLETRKIDAVKRTVTTTDGDNNETTTVTYLIPKSEIDDIKESSYSRYLSGSAYRYGVCKFYKYYPYDGPKSTYSDYIEAQVGYDINTEDLSYTVYYPYFEVATDTVSPAGTVINMFDYWTAGDSEAYRFDSDMSGNTPAAQHTTGINSNKSNYKFFKGSDWTGLPMNIYTGSSTRLPVQGIVEDTLVDGYPQLSGKEGITQLSGETENHASLQYLFDPTEKHAGKKTFKNIKNLFRIDDDGYYYFCSRERFAQFDEDTNTFTEYKSPGVYHNKLYGQFFPFNTLSEVYNKNSDNKSGSPVGDYDGLNHYLAISLKAAFMQKNSGYTNSSNTIPTTFEFERGDDFWLFVDDVLIGDAGGLHPVTHVTINFATGVVSQYNLNEKSYKCQDTTIYDLFVAAGKEDDVAWKTVTIDGKERKIFADNTKHTLVFYCLERGNGESNLMLKYNLSEVPETLVHKVDQYGDDLEGAKFAFYAANRTETEETDGSETITYKYKATKISDGSNANIALPDNCTAEDDENGNTVYTVVSDDDITSEIARYTIAKDGTITCDSKSDDAAAGTVTYMSIYTITPGYTGTTDEDGELLLCDSDGFPYSIENLQELIGSDQCIMREIDIPAGYRTIEDEAYLRINNKRILCENIYESGVWVSNKVQVSAPSALHPVSDSALTGKTSLEVDGEEMLNAEDGTIIYIPTSATAKIDPNGTLFAVVLRRGVTNGTVDDTYEERNKEKGSWLPVYGTDTLGYTVMDSYSIDNVITAAKNQAAYNNNANENVFIDKSGSMMMTFENLPGFTSNYYCYLRAAAGDKPSNIVKNPTTSGQVDQADVHYIIAYYWTSADSLSGATSANTYRISSFSEDYSGDDASISDSNSIIELEKTWGATVTVSNFENKLNVQKLDLDEIPVNGTTFALYDAGQDSTKSKETEEDGTVVEVYHTYYVASDSTTHIYLKPNGSNPNRGTAYIGSYGEKTGEDWTYAVNSTTGVITVTSTDTSVTTTYTINPAVNAEKKSLVTTTHTCTKDCDTYGEYGTGHFNMLRTGQYLLREISAPAGYALNSAQTQILVDEDDVYANAGTSDNGISVGNGTGYVEPLLIKKTDSGAAQYIYGLLNSLSGEATFEDVSRSKFGADGRYIQSNGMYDTAYIDDGVPRTTDSKTNAMVMYLKYSGDSEEEVSYDYERNDVDYYKYPSETKRYGDFADGHKTTGGAIYPDDPTSDEGKTDIKEKHPRLYTDAGWTAISLFQDYEYGSRATQSSYYEDLRDVKTLSANSTGDISNLFSHSTFVRVQDESIAEVGITKTDAATGAKLSGASFILSRTMTGLKKVTYDDGTYEYVDDGEAEISYWAGTDKDGKAIWTEKETDAKVLTTQDNGYLAEKEGGDKLFFGGLPDLPSRTMAMAEETIEYGYGYYSLTEKVAPDGYWVLSGPIQFSIWHGSFESDRESTMSLPSNGVVDIVTNDVTATGERTIEVTVGDYKGNVIPATGGMGTELFVFAGALLILLACCGLAFKLKRRG